MFAVAFAEVGIETLPAFALDIESASHGPVAIADLMPSGFIGALAFRKEAGDEVFAPNAPEFPRYIPALLGLIPEEKLPLGELLPWCLRTIHGFKRIGVVARIPCFSRDGHRRGCEVLYLFKMKVECFRDDSKLGHILFAAAWVRTNKIRYKLLFESGFLVNPVEKTFERMELCERRLTHQS